jgi:hypothetical protein
MRRLGEITLKPLRDTQGTTLLQVTIAMIILAISLLGLAGLQLVAMESDALGHQATVATNLAKDKLAELEEIHHPHEGEDQYIDRDKGITYARQWTIHADAPQEAMITVKVRVSWQGPLADRCVTISRTIKQT